MAEPDVQVQQEPDVQAVQQGPDLQARQELVVQQPGAQVQQEPVEFLEQPLRFYQRCY